MTLAAGQVVEMETTDPFTVSSQDDDHPFALTQYMPGIPPACREGCGPPPLPNLGDCQLGDDEWVFLPPTSQFLKRYVFFADPTYGTTNLVITRVAGPGGFSDVTLECLGKVTGFTPVGAEGKFEVAHVDLVRKNQPVGACGTSRHEATSEGAFGVVIWGTDWASSYGYSAGGNLGVINNVYVPPIVK
jgi:hypothetical protein